MSELLSWYSSDDKIGTSYGVVTDQEGRMWRVSKGSYPGGYELSEIGGDCHCWVPWLIGFKAISKEVM